MLFVFCLRLAFGLLVCLFLLSPAQINPRFYRTHFLVALALTVVAAGLEETIGGPHLGGGFLAALIVTGVLALAGFFCWSLEGAPLGRTLIVGTVAALACGLILFELAAPRRDDLA